MKQYRYWIDENRKVIAGEPIDDPFITTTINPQGWRTALRVLFRRYEIRVMVRGTREAYRVVATGDYTPFREGTETATMEGRAHVAS